MDFVCDLGAGLVAMGEHEEALTLIVNALDVQQRGGKYLYMPALLRMKGLTLASRSTEDYVEAENSLLSAIDWARRQSASLYELKVGNGSCRALAAASARARGLQHISARRWIERRAMNIPRSRARPADPRPASIRRRGRRLAPPAHAPGLPRRGPGSPTGTCANTRIRRGFPVLLDHRAIPACTGRRCRAEISPPQRRQAR